MTIEIDQSGKIEQTNKDTILCLSNDNWDTILISKTVKRKIQNKFRLNKQIRNFIIFTFCAGLAILIKRNTSAGSIIIDQEYTGKNNLIRRILNQTFASNKDSMPVISFRTIGKTSRAHYRASLILTEKLKAKKKVTEAEIWREIKKTEVGKRLKNA